MVANVVLALGPLILFTRHLWRCRYEAVRQYDRLGTDYTREFQQRWIDSRNGRTSERDGLLGSADIQSLADLGNAYDVIRKMWFVPFELRSVVIILVATLLPMVPLALLEIPLLELVKKLGAVAIGGVK
jgi:hypothetical protein